MTSNKRTMTTAAAAVRQPPSQPMDDEYVRQDSDAPVMSNPRMVNAEGDKKSPAQSSAEETADATNSCPLFMNSLPSDFASNSGLAAIASLLDEESESKDNIEKTAPIRTSEMKVNSGGGKATKQNPGIRHSPYKSPNARGRKKDKTTVGEAQLFLSMWKV